MIDHFTKDEFEAALKPISDKVEIEHLGVVQGEYTYRIPFGSDYVFVELRSSVAEDGNSRDDGEDSIRCWLVLEDGKPIGGRGAGKVKTYVTRKPGWQERMIAMIKKTAKFGLWVEPCKKCGKLLNLSVRRGGAYLYCSEDNKNKDVEGYERHSPLLKIDETGESVEEVKVDTDAPPCPKCGKHMVKQKVRYGPKQGKMAWVCMAKEGKKWLNHVQWGEILVEDEDKEESHHDTDEEKDSEMSCYDF